MPTSISPVLAPYMQACLQSDSLTLITSVLETPAYWLTIRLTKAALSGIDDDSSVLQSQLRTSQVIFLSVIRPFEFWHEVGKKIGLDFSTLINKKQLAYIDALNLGQSITQPTSKITKPKSHSLSDLKNAIVAAKSWLLSQHTPDRQPFLIIDGLDFVLATQPDISASGVNVFTTDLRTQCSTVALTLAADAPLLHNVEASATPLEVGHSVLVRSVAHQSLWVLQLRPLDTGHAKDVTGIIQLSRGGAEAGNNDVNLEEGEWLYQVKGDGNTRVWRRGE